MAAGAANKKGARLRRRLWRRVVFASLRGRRPFGPRAAVAPSAQFYRPPFGGHPLSRFAGLLLKGDRMGLSVLSLRDMCGTLFSAHSPTASVEESCAVRHQRGPVEVIRMLMTFSDLSCPLWRACHFRCLPSSTPAPLRGPLPLKGAQGLAAIKRFLSTLHVPFC